jgi:hypothetical protein
LHSATISTVDSLLQDIVAPVLSAFFASWEGPTRTERLTHGRRDEIDTTVEMEDVERLAQQQGLAMAYQKLGRTLQQQTADPVGTMEAALTALASIRCWLDVGTILDGLAAGRRDQLERWEQELEWSGEYLEKLREVVHAELTLSLRERNRLRQDLKPRDMSQ